MWKHANIVPVYKGSGSRYSVENYRPISLTSTICKVMESIIYDKICNHCSLNNLLTDSQHGFRKLKSTIHLIYLNFFMISLGLLMKEIMLMLKLLISQKPSIKSHITCCYINWKSMV